MKKLVVLILAFVLCFAGCGAEKEFVPERGTVENGVYKNSAFGIGFEANSDWYFYSDEEIAATMGKTAEELFPEDFAENLENTETIYDIYAADYYGGSTISINFENINAIYGEIVDEETYLEMAKSEIETNLAAMNILRNEVGKALVSGKEVPCIFVELELSGTTVYEVVVVKKVGNWIGIVTLASVSEDGISSLLENLSFE